MIATYRGVILNRDRVIFSEYGDKFANLRLSNSQVLVLSWKQVATTRFWSWVKVVWGAIYGMHGIFMENKSGKILL